MPPLLATIICDIGIAGLFYLDRDPRARTSRALWLPVIYLWLIGSRPFSQWFGITSVQDNGPQLEGSPFDAAIFALLLVGAIGVLISRSNKVRILLAMNWPILLFFGYCLISVSWSMYPDIAFKRWIKAIDDLAMMLIVVTDGQPLAAFRRLISRVGFLLLPTSVLLIKYYGQYGRAFSADGAPTNTGVTTNKNTLGVVLLVVTLGTVWQIVTLFRDRRYPDRKRHLIAQGVLLTFALVLLKMADSATSLACSVLGSGLILAMHHRAIRGRPKRAQGLCLIVILVGVSIFLLTGQSDVANALGRSSNLSGRTEIWAALLPTVPSSLVGAGFESYWISPYPEKAWGTLLRAGWWHPEILVTEAHNGYIEMYLNLGWIGICLVALILIAGYKRAVAAIRVNPSIASLALAYIMVSAVYSITEAGFRPLDPIWVFLLLAIVTSSAIMAGLFREPVASEKDALANPASMPQSDLGSFSASGYAPEELELGSISQPARWSSVSSRSVSRLEQH